MPLTRNEKDSDKTIRKQTGSPRRSVSTGRVKFDQINSKSRTPKKERTSPSKEVSTSSANAPKSKTTKTDVSGEETERDEINVGSKKIKKSKNGVTYTFSG